MNYIMSDTAELEYQGYLNYLDYRKQKTELPFIGPPFCKQRKLQTLIADMISLAVVLDPLKIEKEGVEEYYFAPLSGFLTKLIENALPVTQAELRLDTSTGWDYTSSLKETLRLVCNDYSFQVASKEHNIRKCIEIAEKIIFIKLKPNALWAIQRYLENPSNLEI